MAILTGAVGNEIVIDGRIRIRILGIDGEEVHLQVNFPEFLSSDRYGRAVCPGTGWLGLESAAGTFGRLSFHRQLVRRSAPRPEPP